MSADYRSAGMEVYGLNIDAGVNRGDSVLAAIEAAVATAHRGFTKATRDDLLEKAEDIDADASGPLCQLYDDGVASLIWYAALLDETLPHEDQLENDGHAGTR